MEGSWRRRQRETGDDRRSAAAPHFRDSGFGIAGFVKAMVAKRGATGLDFPNPEFPIPALLTQALRGNVMAQWRAYAAQA
ncbi:hypothetical protein [Xanthomonas sp. GW]|uniref:hypothetical protein n=1 Tax=Xanthomonas sp. GW TaxID=2724121 RepID=UPI001C8D06DB|nr:hypothetical protein [Xanthomonas sp. GW]